MPDFKTNLLQAREARWAFFSAQKQSFITFNLNIPGYPKTSPQINTVFERVSAELGIFLELVFELKNYHRGQDEAGLYLYIPCPYPDLKSVKNILDEFERTHPLGRLLDIDVYNHQLDRITNNRFKKCFLCERQAQICIRNKNHTLSEVRATCEKQLASCLNQDLLAQKACLALIKEASVDPKPGLVTRKSHHCHPDMDFFLLVKSALALRPGFTKMAQAENLAEIREVGLQMEQAMYQATNNINTHKGLIFLMGIAVCAVKYSDVFQAIKNICKNITQELQPNLKTHGAKIYQKYGFAGARGEAENGMPLVLQTGFKALTKYQKHLKNDDDVYTAVLTEIIARNNDTNLLYRGGLEKLKTVQKMALNIINQGFWSKAARLKYQELCTYCQKHNLSCGGSADMLALTIFFDKINLH